MTPAIHAASHVAFIVLGQLAAGLIIEPYAVAWGSSSRDMRRGWGLGCLISLILGLGAVAVLEATRPATPHDDGAGLCVVEALERARSYHQ